MIVSCVFRIKRERSFCVGWLNAQGLASTHSVQRPSWRRGHVVGSMVRTSVGRDGRGGLPGWSGHTDANPRRKKS